MPEPPDVEDTPASRRERDLALLARAGQAPRCVHVKTNGLRCGSPAMRHSPYCFFHDRWHNRPDDDTFPPFEDGNSVQFALMQIVERLRRETFRAGAIDPRLVNSLIFAVKTAGQNLRNTTFDPAQEQSILVDPLDVFGDRDQTVPLAPQTFLPAPRERDAVARKPSKQVSISEAPDFSRGSGER